MNDTQLMNFFAKTGNGIVKRIDNTAKSDDVTRATHMLMRRLIQSGCTLRELYDNAKRHEWSADGASILRTSYDAMLQALYILVDPTEQQELARRFLDFEIVERVKLLRVFDKKLTSASRHIAGSRKRPAAEPEIQQEFRRVCNKYRYDARKPPEHWYTGTLSDLAARTGYQAEYEVLTKQLSAIVHSSIFGISLASGFRDSLLVIWQWRFAFRVLDRIAAYSGAVLTDTEDRRLKMSRRSVFDR